MMPPRGDIAFRLRNGRPAALLLVLGACAPEEEARSWPSQAVICGWYAEDIAAGTVVVSEDDHVVDWWCGEVDRDDCAGPEQTMPVGLGAMLEVMAQHDCSPNDPERLPEPNAFDWGGTKRCGDIVAEYYSCWQAAE